MAKTVSKGQQVKDLQQRLDVLGTRCTELERQNAQLRNENHVMELQKVQWEGDKSKQQVIIQNQLTSVNQQNNEYLQEIERLRAEIQSIKG